MLRKIRMIIALTLALCMVLYTTALAADSGYSGVVTIVHTNDVHGTVTSEPYVKGYVDALRAEDKNVVLVSSGDAFKGAPFADMTDGLDVATVMNMTGYDMFTMGNHEQMLGLEKFKKIADKVDFPVLAANISSEWREAIPEIKDYVIKEFGGTKIAFIGITYPSLEEGSVANIITSAEQAKAAAQAEGASVFIAVTHLGILDPDTAIRSTYLAEKCPWLTAIIDAHCHTAHDNGLLQSDVLIAEAGDYGKYIGVVELTFKSGAVTGATAKLIPITGHEKDCGITPDKDVLAFISEVEAKNAAYLNEVVATTPVFLDGARGASRTRETNFGNIVTDAMRQAAQTDIAIVSGPYLRVDVPAGDITRAQLMTTLYADVELCVVEVTGQEIYDIMVAGTKLYPKENSGFTHVSGIMVEFNQALGNSVISIRMPDGSALDLDATYTCAVRSENLSVWFPNRAYTTGHGTMCQVVADYLNSGVKVTREVAGRIKPVTVFTDVIGHWAENAIYEMLKLQSITGYPDGTFRPDAAITLNGFIKLLTDAFKLSPEDVKAIFPEGGSSEPVARKDAALYIMRMIDLKDIALTKSAAKPYTDLEGVSKEAAAAIGALQSAKLVSGVGGGQFAPNANATRGAIAVLVDKILTSMAIVVKAA